MQKYKLDITHTNFFKYSKCSNNINFIIQIIILFKNHKKNIYCIQQISTDFPLLHFSTATYKMTKNQ